MSCKPRTISLLHEEPPSPREDSRARRYWRSREELDPKSSLHKIARDEFLPQALEPDPVTRRSFLKVLGASVALAGAAAGCKTKEAEEIVPYVQQPENVVPGEPAFYATAFAFGGYAQGVVATSHEGRPTKIEGNPDHSASLGASDVFMQASLLDMYDPDRAQTVSHAGTISDWDTFIGAIRPRLFERRNNGAAVALLTENITSPTLLAQIDQFRKTYPGSRWFVHDPIGRTNSREGLRQATGRDVLPRYDFSQAKVIVSLDSNFLYDEPGHLRYARDFIDGRRVTDGRTDMNRLYVVESTYTLTGTMADHRWAVKPSEIAGIAAAMAGESGGPPWMAAVMADLAANRGNSIVIAGMNQPPHVHALAHQINQSLGNVGSTVHYDAPLEGTPDAALDGLAQAMDSREIDTLFIFGGNPAYTSPVDLRFNDRLLAFSTAADASGAPQNLTVHLSLYDNETSHNCHWLLPQTHYLEEWSDGRAYDGTTCLVQPLILPLYAGRSMIEVAQLLTSGFPRTGYNLLREFWQAQAGAGDFESRWGSWLEKGLVDAPTPSSTTRPSPMPEPDTASAGATLEPGQATTAPSEAEKPAHQEPLLARGPAIWAQHPEVTPEEPTNRGSVDGPVTFASGSPSAAGLFEIAFRPDPNAWDGTWSNNAWLQELPKPLSKLTWDNAATISPATATRLGVNNCDMIRIKAADRALEIPVWIIPGEPDNVVTLTLGYGRWRAGSVGTQKGFNAYALRTWQNPWFMTATGVEKIDGNYPLVSTWTHNTIATRHLGAPYPLDAKVIKTPGPDDIDNRTLVRVGTLKQYLDDPKFARRMDDKTNKGLTLYPGFEHNFQRNLSWGMSIDQTACIGCNACVMACQAENNSPVVGKDQVARGREMHWIRIDTFFAGDEEHPDGAFHQPLPCQQCENAPCELVCPVGATVHGNEGLNEMVYNRCIGTRYCSNNCPYKVRRFNFLNFADYKTESLKLMRNPEVTVRSRGVMEKCTYCIQRITKTRIGIEKLQVQMDERARELPDQADQIQRKSAQQRQDMLDDLQTACQQSCPTEAIIFGNINSELDPIHPYEPDHVSKVKKLKTQPLDYSLLKELITQPRTTYSARIVNPNPVIGSGMSAGGEA